MESLIIIINEYIKTMPNSCKNLVIRCMDYRLNNSLNEWIKNQGILDEGYDLVSIAGAGKRIAEGVDEFFLDIGVSCKLHSVDRIILIRHSNCGAYAMDYNFSSIKEEKEKQMSDMKKVRKIIKKKYPHVEVVKVWAELKDPKGEKIEFSIINED
jgi:carbonic anhydrase